MTFVPSYPCITSLIVLFDLIYMAYYQFVLILKCKIIVLFCVLSGNLLKRFDANKQISLSLYKPPPTRLRTLDLPVLSHPCLYAGDFNCRHADWGYDDNSPDGECLAGWASINCLALLYNAKDAASFYSGRWNTGTNPDLAFASVGPNNRLPDRRVLDKFPRSQHRPSLITPPRFAMAVPSMPVKRWNFCKAKWSHYIALTNKFAKTLLPPDSLDLDAAYQDFCNTIKKAAKKTIPRGY